MAVAEKTTYTADDLWELSKSPEYADQRLELWEGNIIQMTPSSFIPAAIAADLVIFIGVFVKEHRLGYVTTAEGGYRLSPDTVLAPDVGFIAKGRVSKLPERYYEGAPDLAVEVVSPTDSDPDVHRKAKKYLRYGVQLVWVIYPEEKIVEGYSLAENNDVVIHELDINGVLDGGLVLPGFTLAVSEIFKALE